MRGRRRLIHLNGAPGIGKSTLAARYAAEHPGTMAVELDVLRTWVGGWREADHDLLLDVRSAPRGWGPGTTSSCHSSSSWSFSASATTW